MMIIRSCGEFLVHLEVHIETWIFENPNTYTLIYEKFELLIWSLRMAFITSLSLTSKFRNHMGVTSVNYKLIIKEFKDNFRTK